MILLWATYFPLVTNKVFDFRSRVIALNPLNNPEYVTLECYGYETIIASSASKLVNSLLGSVKYRFEDRHECFMSSEHCKHSRALAQFHW